MHPDNLDPAAGSNWKTSRVSRTCDFTCVYFNENLSYRVRKPLEVDYLDFHRICHRMNHLNFSIGILSNTVTHTL